MELHYQLIWQLIYRQILNGRYAIKQDGRPSKLTNGQKRQLERIIQRSPTEQGIPFAIWTSKLIQYLIRKKFGVKYVMRQITNLMNELKFSLQRPRPEHILANKRMQKEFKKNYDERLRDLIKQDMRSSFWTKQFLQ